MHYHVLVVDDSGEHVDELTFERQDEAEARVATVARDVGGPAWTGRRYPGRSWRRQELAVYLDRQAAERDVPRLELSIIRCETSKDEHGFGCWRFHRGVAV